MIYSVYDRARILSTKYGDIVDAVEVLLLPGVPDNRAFFPDDSVVNGIYDIENEILNIIGW